MSVEDVFRVLQQALDAVGIPYMITGSFASSAHGEPRASKDIDIVIAPTREQLIAFVKQFPSGKYHVVEQEALAAFESSRMFNVIDYATGWRVDLIIKKQRPFSDSEFERREVLEFSGLRLSFAAAEDVLISKLEWVKEGESQRQLEDAVGIIRVQGDSLDVRYVEYWVRQLGLAQEWTAAKARAAS